MKDGMPSEIADMMLGEMPPEQQMYVISNNKGINGAVSMLYEDGLHDLAEKLGSDLYIMPSSIHEVIAVSTDMGNPNELAAMVAEINMDQVALDERLSNQVYHYDKELRKVTLATDTPNKRLDGIVAEAPMVYEAGKTRKEAAMEKEITMEELVKMLNESSGKIIIHVELGEERDSDEGKESVQP